MLNVIDPVPLPGDGRVSDVSRIVGGHVARVCQRYVRCVPDGYLRQRRIALASVDSRNPASALRHRDDLRFR